MALEDTTGESNTSVAPEELIASLEQEKNSPITEPVAPVVSNIPEKFKGKSIEDVVKSYQELESQLGRQGAELGELRKLADEFVRKQDQNEEPIDFTTDPDKAVKHTIEKELGPIKEDVMELRRIKMDTKLKEIHGDYMDVVQSEDFQKWVVDSPIRIELFARADRNYDPASAIELLNMFKATRPTTTPAIDNSGALHAASMEATSTHEAPSKRTYRRADLVNLKLRNPAKYLALQPEIMQAYAEGRVR